jgi:hypothetical protein
VANSWKLLKERMYASIIYWWTTWSECHHTKWAVDRTISSPSFWRSTLAGNR